MDKIEVKYYKNKKEKNFKKTIIKKILRINQNKYLIIHSISNISK